MTPRVVGRYVVHDEFAAGGMASVHLGRLLGPVGFARTVAIKCLHRHLAREPEFVAMFLDEARLAARIRHPNVVATVDVLEDRAGLMLVMDFVFGESVARLWRLLAARGERCPPAIAVTIACEALLGLHAAHEAKGDDGAPLGIVHRDVSPQNVLVGVDGITRVVDFGVAKAVGRLQTTLEGQIKGKTAYMSPEQVRGRALDRRSDVYSASVVLWELLTGERLFWSDTPAFTMTQVLEKVIEAPSTRTAGLSEALDAAVLCGLARDPDRRFSTAREMALALQEAVPRVAATTIGDWVQTIAADTLADLARCVERLEGDANAAFTRGSTIEGQTPPSSATSRVKPAPPEVSGISVNTPFARRAKKPWALGWLLAGALSTAAGFVLWNQLRASSDGAVERAEAAAPSSAAVFPEPASSAAPPPAAPALDVSATAPIQASAAATHAVRIAPAAGKNRAAKGACSPPYTIDAKGVHIPKPQCY